MRRDIVSFLFLSATLVASCSSTDGVDPQTTATGNRTGSVSMNKDDYPVFPDADTGADPSVPAELGGKGFTGEGWQTHTSFDLIGDPRAVKGGTLRDHMISFPGTLRMAGPEWNSVENYVITQLVYETPLALHPTTLEYIPVLATHWKIEPDNLTYRFRINPNARFSDGTPVTAEDFVASHKFHADKTLQDPYYYTQFNKFEPPVAESPYIFRIKAKELGWENFFMVATGLRAFPAHVLKSVDGAAYVRDYNFKLFPGTGPYILNEADIAKGQSVTLRRRQDYWGEKHRYAIGQFNVDEFRRVVVRDENLAIEMLKKGDLDFYEVRGNPQVWMDRFNTDDVQRGILVKKAVLNNYPADMAYIGFNMKRKPFDDVRVRKAFALLFNREQVIEKLFQNLYKPINSHYPATIYENPNNPTNNYNPQEAFRLLTEAGWKDRDAQGRLTKDGQPLQVEILYARQVFEPWLTVYQEDLRKVGITVNLRLVTFETSGTLMFKRQFQYIVGAWGAGSVFPSPYSVYHSSMADIENSNNITGLKNPRVDEVIERYDVTLDSNQRIELLKELDGLLANEYIYTLRWYDPAQRIVHLNKFGMPQGSFSRVGDVRGSLAPGIPQLWWVDPDKSQKFDQALRDNSIRLEVPPVDDTYWQEQFGEAQKELEAQPTRQ